MHWIRSGAYASDMVSTATRHTTISRPLAFHYRPPRRDGRNGCPAIPRAARQYTGECDDELVGDPGWVWVGDQRMFVVGYTTGGAPFGCYADEVQDWP